jgi:hypothetical protein
MISQEHCAAIFKRMCFICLLYTPTTPYESQRDGESERRKVNPLNKYKVIASHYAHFQKKKKTSTLNVNRAEGNEGIMSVEVSE